MYNIELTLMPDGLANHLVADVILVLGKRHQQPSDVLLSDFRNDIDVVRHAGFAVRHCGNGTGHEVRNIKSLERFDNLFKQFIWSHEEISSPLPLRLPYRPIQGEFFGGEP